MLQPHISLRVLLRLHSVAITEPRMVAAAAVTSASVTGSRLASDAGTGLRSGDVSGVFGMPVHSVAGRAPIVIKPLPGSFIAADDVPCADARQRLEPR